MFLGTSSLNSGDAMFLTAAELCELTGYKRHADQRKWLTTRAWLFEVAATGKPVVSRNYAEIRLGSGEKPVTAKWRPNVASIRKQA